jgi:hypothetical protein
MANYRSPAQIRTKDTAAIAIMVIFVASPSPSTLLSMVDDRLATRPPTKSDARRIEKEWRPLAPVPKGRTIVPTLGTFSDAPTSDE